MGSVICIDNEEVIEAIRKFDDEKVDNLKLEYGAVDGGFVIILLSYKRINYPRRRGVVDSGLENLIV